MSARAIPDDIIAVQKEASDPARSAFVTANAGSGKTYVLVQRVIRLLLAGTAPAKILCLTFTKAAAANMAKGVFDTLARWVALNDAALRDALRDLDGRPPTPARLHHARRLFAQALETPGGLKVQTIHAFCARLLHQFPFEAKVAARFSVLEERAEEDLIHSLRATVLMEAANTPEAPLGRALSRVAAAAADQTFTAVLRAALAEREAIAAWIDHAQGLSGVHAHLSRMLDLPEDESEETLTARILQPAPIVAMLRLMAAQAPLGAQDGKLFARLERLARHTGSSPLTDYLSVFLTDDLTPRANIITKGLGASAPELSALFDSERARVEPLAAAWLALCVRERSMAMLTLAEAIIARYREEKSRRGLLDYQDIIIKTRDLLASVDAAWVHYKLDLGIDHVLIDEAQDTSAEQWDIIERLVREFTAGEGARTTPRSIFAVGDEKQSIYSFQGAAPRKFAEMRRLFERAHRNAMLPFETSRLHFSFRSGANVLGAVDTVFARKEIGASITDDEAGAPSHQALPEAAPGLVEIWPLTEAGPRANLEGWDMPLDAAAETSPPVQLARRIATTLAGWLAGGECVAPGRPIAPGDILILVRQRGALFDAIIRALKDARIAVAGADRLVLTEHIAVMDLLVIADALLSPDDDLALATALKSPLFGLGEDELFTLAWNRKGTLRQALAARASDLVFGPIAARVERLAQDVRWQTPFVFYGTLLGRDGGREQLLSRLSHEAADALDEFLSLALSYEARETPTVQGFVAWMRAATSEIKRDMDIGRDEVRVMTVHGAKGLEADLVIVADTTTVPTGRPPQLLTLSPQDAPPGTPAGIVWPGRKATDPPLVAQARAQALRAAEDEYRRLLYVAMTRAKSRLIICGAMPGKAPPRGCWYELVGASLGDEAMEVPAPYGDGVIQRWTKVAVDLPAAAPRAEEPGAAIARPDWLVPLPGVAPRQPVLTPSTAAGSHRNAPRARARGRHAHRLLQSLPELPADARAEAAAAYLARAADDLTAEDRDRLAADVLALMATEPFAALFSSDSRAEVPLVGWVEVGGQRRRVSAQVDRLLVTNKHVLLVDYKTDRVVPSRPQDAPTPYLVQLALYRALVSTLYPDRDVRTAFLWTHTPELMAVPDGPLNAALHQVGVSSP